MTVWARSNGADLVESLHGVLLTSSEATNARGRCCEDQLPTVAAQELEISNERLDPPRPPPSPHPSCPSCCRRPLGTPARPCSAPSRPSRSRPRPSRNELQRQGWPLVVPRPRTPPPQLRHGLPLIQSTHQGLLDPEQQLSRRFHRGLESDHGRERWGTGQAMGCRPWHLWSAVCPVSRRTVSMELREASEGRFDEQGSANGRNCVSRMRNSARQQLTLKPSAQERIHIPHR